MLLRVISQSLDREYLNIFTSQYGYKVLGSFTFEVWGYHVGEETLVLQGFLDGHVVLEGGVEDAAGGGVGSLEVGGAVVGDVEVEPGDVEGLACLESLASEGVGAVEGHIVVGVVIVSFFECVLILVVAQVFNPHLGASIAIDGKEASRDYLFSRMHAAAKADRLKI